MVAKGKQNNQSQTGDEKREDQNEEENRGLEKDRKLAEREMKQDER